MKKTSNQPNEKVGIMKFLKTEENKDVEKSNTEESKVPVKENKFDLMSFLKDEEPTIEIKKQEGEGFMKFLKKEKSVEENKKNMPVKEKKEKKEKKENSEKSEKRENIEKENIEKENIESDEESVTEEKIEIPQKKEFLFDINIIINNDEIIEIIKRFPKNYQEDFINNVPNNENIIDFVFDINNYPYVVLSKGNEKRIHFSETKVSSDYINQIIEDLYFLDNNRSGIDKTLHRISIKKNVKDEIDGVTIRVGRPIIGISSILDDIIEQNKSILFLGYH
jgi:hypothetical protein